MSIRLIILIIVAIVTAIVVPLGLYFLGRVLGSKDTFIPMPLFACVVGAFVLVLGYDYTPEGKADDFNDNARYEALSKAKGEAVIVKVLEKSATNNGIETFAKYQFKYNVGFVYVNYDGETIWDVESEWVTIPESEFRTCSIGDLYDLANYRFVKEELDENGNTIYVKVY